MLAIVLRYWLDVALFAAIAFAAAAGAHVWLKRAVDHGLPRLGWTAICTVVALAGLGTVIVDQRERSHLRERLEGLAPTYGREIELMGHAGIGFDTPSNSATYLKIIDAEIRWEDVNPNVADIYTYRRTADGKIAFVVDSETDYDGNHVIEGEREQRTAIGEVYDEATPAFAAALDGVAGFDGEPYSDRWGTWVSAYIPLHDIAGRVEAALGVDFSAGQWHQDIALTRLGALALAGVLLTVILGAAIITTLSRSELAKRAALQRQLVDASRQAGMAEVATGVLHNVGNVLNSVNVSAGVLTEKVRASKLSGLGRAAGMIRDNRGEFARFVTDDAKGRVLPDYLVKLSDLLAGEQQDWLGELSTLSRNLDHVKRIVASQQTLAKSVDVIETFELADLCEDALRINAPAAAAARVEVVRHFAACPSMTADRHLVLQILVNLLSNAVKAMAESPGKTLTLGIDTTDEQGTPLVHVRVTDSGVGITPENLNKLFTHGFTTRHDGHGFGLHHSANVTHVMGGRLVAASDGDGRGATFTLSLPLIASALIVSEKGNPCPTA